MFKLCENEDGKSAVGTGIRPIRWCRDCYITECGPDFQAWKVVVDADDIAGIACAKTGETIETGGTVWLDPVETNIPALVYAGHIEALPKMAAAPKAPKTTEG